MARDSYVDAVGFTPLVEGALVSMVRLRRLGQASRTRCYRARLTSARRVVAVAERERREECSAVVPGLHGWVFVRWGSVGQAATP